MPPKKGDENGKYSAPARRKIGSAQTNGGGLKNPAQTPKTAAKTGAGKKSTGRPIGTATSVKVNGKPAAAKNTRRTSSNVMPPSKMKKAGISKKQKMWIGIAAAVVVVVIAVIVAVALGGGLGERTTFAKGVSVAGVDVSGCTVEEAKEKVNPAIAQEMEEILISFTVRGEAETLDAEQMGVTDNLDVVLEEAFAYTGEAKDFPITYQADEETVRQKIEADSEEWAISPQNAKVIVNKNKSEDAKTTSAKITYEEEQNGYSVKIDELYAMIEEKLAAKDYTAFEAPSEETQPALTVAYLKENLDVIGTYTSYFNKSPLNKRGRVFNIWKMADIVNGVEIKPGETWSINEEAGDRTTANGWADASGIENGISQDVPGGGICQVSSTLYNAVIRAELDIVERKHHSWPSDYIPIGLDATISTGSPDLKIRNNYDTSIYLIVTCDGKAGKVTVKVYGIPQDKDYTVDFDSKIIEEIEPGEPITEVNEELEPGTEKVIRSAKKGYKVEAYKIYKDKETGKEIKREVFHTDTYAPKAKMIEVGPELPEPSETPEASPSPSATATSEPIEQPTTEPTTKPSETDQDPDVGEEE